VSILREKFASQNLTTLSLKKNFHYRWAAFRVVYNLQSAKERLEMWYLRRAGCDGHNSSRLGLQLANNENA
jgi:hypothetical protein